MLRIALCDDDRAFLEGFAPLVERLFTQAGQQVKVTAFCEGQNLIESVEKDKQFYDIVFLDVEMPGVHGFQVAQRLRELNRAFLLLFTTYMEHQSREGYLYGAFRYVFKNNLEAEVGEAISSILTKFAAAAMGHETVTFKCRSLGILEQLTVKKADIVLLKVEKTRRVILRTVFAEYELVIKPLSEYAKCLAPPDFVPIMRNTILNFNHVEGIERGFFVLTGGLTLSLGIKREVQQASKEKYLHFLGERV